MTVEVFGAPWMYCSSHSNYLRELLENPLFHALPMLTRYSGLLSELWTAQHVFRGPELSTELFPRGLVAGSLLVWTSVTEVRFRNPAVAYSISQPFLLQDQ